MDKAATAIKGMTADNRNAVVLCVLSDYDVSKPKKKIKDLGEDRFKAEKIDAAKEADIKKMIKKYDIDTVINACDPSFNPVIFDTAFELGVIYIDLALSLSEKHPTDPFNKCGTMLGDYQFNKHDKWKKKGLMALVGIGVTPGITNVYAKYAAEYLMDEIDEIHIRCGGDLTIENSPAVAFTWSPWTAIEECTTTVINQEELASSTSSSYFLNFKATFLRWLVLTLAIRICLYKASLNSAGKRWILKMSPCQYFQYFSLWNISKSKSHEYRIQRPRLILKIRGDIYEILSFA